MADLDRVVKLGTFYFGDGNLLQDRFLGNLIAEDEEGCKKETDFVLLIFFIDYNYFFFFPLLSFLFLNSVIDVDVLLSFNKLKALNVQHDDLVKVNKK